MVAAALVGLLDDTALELDATVTVLVVAAPLEVEAEVLFTNELVVTTELEVEDEVDSVVVLATAVVLTAAAELEAAAEAEPEAEAVELELSAETALFWIVKNGEKFTSWVLELSWISRA